VKLHIGNRIRELREKRGLTQEQLAKRVKMMQSRISNIENSVRGDNLTVLTLKRIAAGLGAKVKITLHDH
jgi:transcriptional regulator with XRE-family HTH domain